MQPWVIAGVQIQPLEARHPAAHLGARLDDRLVVEIEVVFIPSGACWSNNLSHHRQHDLMITHPGPECNFRFAAPNPIDV